MPKPSFLSCSLFLLLFLVSASLSGQDWVLTNPVKSSSRFYDADFLDEQNGWLVNLNDDRVLKTTDGGETWSVPFTGIIFGNWYAVEFPGADTGFVAGSGGDVYRTLDGGNTWSTVNQPTNDDILDLQMLNNDLGWSVGMNGRIYKTTNAGNSWTSQSSGTSYPLRGVYFLDADTGYVSGFGGRVLKTTNGGNVWTQLNTNNSDYLYRVAFSTPANGVAVGRNGALIHTTDYGNTWTTYNTGVSTYLYDVIFFSALEGIVVGESTVFRTTDGGVTWQSGSLPGDVYGLEPAGNQGRVFAMGNQVIDRSENYGQNWISTHAATPVSALQRAYFLNDSVGHVVGYGSTNGASVRTSNRGRTWFTNFQSIASNSGFFDVHFPTPQIGYACGYQSVRKTTNGGSSWSYLPNPPSASHYAIHFVTPDIGFLGGGGGGVPGHLYKTTNGGINWTQYSATSVPDIEAFWFTDAQTGYAVTQGQTVMKTTDQGNSWNSTNLGSTGAFSKVFFLNDSLGWVGGNNISGFRTTDAGATWTSLPTVPNFLAGIHFINPDTGYAVSYAGDLLESQDGGVTWAQISTAPITSHGFLDAFFTDEAVYAVGNSGDIYRVDLFCPPQPMLSAISGDSISCPGMETSFSVVGSQGLDLNWNLSGGGVLSGTGNSVLVDWQNPGVYSLTCSGSARCWSSLSETIDVEVFPRPVAEIVLPTMDTSYCEDDTFLLRALDSTGYQFQWKLGTYHIPGATSVDHYRTVSGNFSVVVTDSNGCMDSSATRNVTMDLKPATPVISQLGSTLVVNAAGGIQWFLNGTAISGATGTQFVPSQSGNYRVVITDLNGCVSDSSNVIFFQFTGLSDAGLNGLKVYPNPSESTLFIDSGSKRSGDQLVVSLFDLSGRVVFEFCGAGVDGLIEIPVRDFPRGLYLLELRSEGERRFVRVALK